MEITLNTPALLFPAISLILLAYTNRFMSLAKLIRDLHARWQESHNALLVKQIRNLSLRLRLCRDMQGLGIVCMLLCVVCMALVWRQHQQAAVVVFALSLVCLLGSLSLSFWEIYISTGALQHELSDLQHAEDSRAHHLLTGLRLRHTDPHPEPKPDQQPEDQPGLMPQLQTQPKPQPQI
jgi:hypothetical protein